MTTLRVIIKIHGKWQAVDMPPPEKITAKMLETWHNKPCRIEITDGERKLYAYGDAAVKWPDEDCKVMMDIPALCHYWSYKLLEFGIDTFSRIEMREEREAIMAAEGVPTETIAQVLEQYPLKYGA